MFRGSKIEEMSTIMHEAHKKLKIEENEYVAFLLV